MQNSAFEQEVLKLTNAFRKSNGLKALVLDQSLEKAADSHSREMAEKDYFSHTGKNGSRPWDRAEQAGYESRTVGENIAAGYTSAKAVVDGWINSPGHRANMLNAQYNEIGLGHYYLANDTGNVNYRHYWTQVFGKGNITAPNPQPSPNPAPSPKPNSNDLGRIRGTNRADRLIGSSRNQRIFGRQGNDFIDGKGGNDVLFGHRGNDTIVGGAGNDRIYGGNNNDKLYGGAGNDTLLGASRSAPNEKDVLTGGTGADRFVLGNKSQSFYKDRNAKSLGIKDYAFITDFNRGQGDVIQLNNDHKYRLGAAPKGVENGRGLFIDNPVGQQDELIAVIKNGGNLQLNSGAFSFV